MLKCYLGVVAYETGSDSFWNVVGGMDRTARSFCPDKNFWKIIRVFGISALATLCHQPGMV